MALLLAKSADISTVPKTLIFSQTKDAVYKIYNFLHTSAKYPKSVSMFHASQSDKTRAFVQSSFYSASSEIRCISATIAFGMVGCWDVYYTGICKCVLYVLQGMDIPDVEVVIVNGLPSTLSQLYQVV